MNPVFQVQEKITKSGAKTETDSVLITSFHSLRVPLHEHIMSEAFAKWNPQISP